MRVSAKADDGSGAPASHLVATLLVQKEEELRQLTMPSPGQLPPRAAVVAGIRKEIADLRAQLKSAVAANLPPTLAADLPIPPSFPSPSTAATIGSATRSRSSTTPSPAMLSSTSNPSSTERARKSAAAGGIAAREALLLVEQQLSVASSGSGSDSEEDLGAKARTALYAVEQSLSMGMAKISRFSQTEELAEYEALQQENLLLKQRLEALQEYERKLEYLKEQAESKAKHAAEEKKKEEEEKKKKEDSKAAASVAVPAAPVVGEAEPLPEKKKRAPRKTAAAKVGVEGEEVKPKVKRAPRKKADGASSSSDEEGAAAAGVKVTRKRATKKTVAAAVSKDAEAEALQNIVNAFL
jgi:hypothetical protein